MSLLKRFRQPLGGFELGSSNDEPFDSGNLIQSLFIEMGQDVGIMLAEFSSAE